MAGADNNAVEDVTVLRDPGKIDYDKQNRADRFVIRVGNIVAWAFPILMFAIVAQVFLRGFGHNQAWLDDAHWWMYGFAMVTAFGYAITTSSHVRVDIFHQYFNEEKKARIEAFAIGWLLMPFLAIMADVLIHYAWSSILAGEGSDSPNGLHRLYLLKSALPLLFLLSGVAAWAVFVRSIAVFRTPTLATQLIWAFPTALFVVDRIVHYIGYWVVFLTNDDINPRRITREPFFEYTLPIAVVVVLLLIGFGYLRGRSRNAAV